MTLVTRLVRSEMLEVLRTDYIKFARARGLPERAINFGHALKNTLVPVITVIGLQLGAIIAFAIITETVFQWPGMGLMFIQAVQNADIPVMAAYLMLVAFLFVLINFIVDLDLRAHRPAHPHPGARGVTGTAMLHERNDGYHLARAATARSPSPLRGAALQRAARQRPVPQLPALQAGGAAALLTALHGGGRAARAADRAAQSLRPGVAEPARCQHAAGVGEGGRPPLPARHRRPGPRHPLHHPLRHALARC